MDRLADAVELLDGPLDDPATLAGNLRDLRRINRWLGGVRLSADAIDALAAHRDSLTVLDVGTGGADIPMALLARAGQRGRGLSVVGLDSRPEVLTAAALAGFVALDAPDTAGGANTFDQALATVLANFKAVLPGFSPDRRVVICDPTKPAGDFDEPNNFWGGLPYYYHNNFHPAFYSPQPPLTQSCAGN
jgi:hypothetical protein